MISNVIINKKGGKNMKKILSLLFVLGISTVCAEELITANAPAWNEFVPPAYVDVKAPKGLGRFNDTAAYWYKRKVEFDNEVEKCQAINEAEAQFSCYQDLKVKQYQKNSDYNARLEAQEQMRQLPHEMMTGTENMLPINGYLNNFARFQQNEIR